MTLQRLLLDTDIGSDVDDALALLYAIKHPQISLEGVTTVYGKTDIRAKIAKKILNYAEMSEVPVIAGYQNPIRSGMPIWHTEREGEGILNSKEYLASLESMNIGDNAADFLIDKIMSHPGEYNIVTIGALTNLAKAVEK